MASQQIGKVESDIQIKAGAGQFHDVFCRRTHHIASICPKIIQSVQILQGQWGTQGSVICWNYVHDGKACISKEIVDIDRENHKMNFQVLEGDLLKYYKSFKFILQVTPQNNGSTVRWTMEYEKLNAQIPDPHSMMQIVIDMSKDIDAHLTNHA